MFVRPNIVKNFASLFKCTTVSRASDYVSPSSCFQNLVPNYCSLTWYSFTMVSDRPRAVYFVSFLFLTCIRIQGEFFDWGRPVPLVVFFFFSFCWLFECGSSFAILLSLCVGHCNCAVVSCHYLFFIFFFFLCLEKVVLYGCSLDQVTSYLFLEKSTVQLLERWMIPMEIVF